MAQMGRWAMIFGGYSRSSDDDSEGGGGGGGLGAILFLILAPIAALLIQLWVSRTREYEADHTGAELTGNPQGLARALEKLEGWSKRIPLDASPTTAHLCIVKPFSGGGLTELFSTHPPMEKRIARLMEMR
jgi:heat shock protein HtpX